MSIFRRALSALNLNDRWMALAIIFAGVAGLTYFHYTVPMDFSAVHLTHYYGFYIIIIYAAFRFGLWGGLISAVFISFIYDIRVYQSFFMFPHHLIRSTVEVSMMYAVGLVAGYFSSKLTREKRNLEAVSQKLQASLELLEKSTNEKIRLEKQLAHDDRLRLMGQLSAGVAHEIRNPLAAIKSATDLIKKGSANEEVLAILASETDRLGDFVKQFLQYVHFGKHSSDIVDMPQLLQEVSDLTRLITKGTNLEFKQSCGLPVETVINGDKNALKQSLLNIIMNSAEKLGTHGTITLACYLDDAKRVNVRIHDNGAPIPPEEIEHIFEPFYTTKPSGTGLGLPIAMKIFREHDATVSISCEDGVAFTITFGGAS